VTESGMIIEVSSLHLPNVHILMMEIGPKIVTDMSEVQSEKARSINSVDNRQSVLLQIECY
jgi:hypothetical protein